MIRQREVTKQEQLAIDRQLFEQRTNLRQAKLNLPDQYKEGDEDILINQKVTMSDILQGGALLTYATAKEEALRHSTRTRWSIELTTKIRWQIRRGRPGSPVGPLGRSGETHF